jgi:hypothetical protein
VEIVLNTLPKKLMNVVSFELASHAYIEWTHYQVFAWGDQEGVSW